MRRNNCWLAVLAVSAVLPILRNGLAGGRLPVDYENVERPGNESKAAYEVRGSNQGAPSIRTKNETDAASRDEVAKLSLEARRTSYFPRAREQVNSSAKESSSVSGESTKAISWQRSTKIADAAVPEERQIWTSFIDESMPANEFSLPAEESKFEDDLSRKDSPERPGELRTNEQSVEATRGSFVESPRATRQSTVSEISVEGRLSSWISHGAIKDSSGRPNVVTRRVSDRYARKSLEDKTLETNQWGSSTRLLDSYYGHVEKSSRPDDSLTTSRGDARKGASFMENQPIEAERTGATDGGDTFSEINARNGDIGFSTDSRDDARDWSVGERSSRIDAVSNISMENGTVERDAEGKRIFATDRKFTKGSSERTAAGFIGFEGRLIGKRKEKLTQNFPTGKRRSSPIKSSKKREEEHLANVAKSVPKFARRSSNRGLDGSQTIEKNHRSAENSRGVSVPRKSDTVRFVEGIYEPRDVSLEQRSTVNSDVQGDNGSVSSIQSETRAFTVSSGSISIHSVSNFRQHPASVREKGNSSRDTAPSVMSTEEYRSGGNEGISLPADLHTASYYVTNETVDEENSNFTEYRINRDEADDGSVISNATDVEDEKDAVESESRYFLDPGDIDGTVPPTKDQGKGSRASDPSNSLTEQRDREVENYEERKSGKLNGSPTNRRIIVFTAEGPRSQDSLNQNILASADEIDDNESVGGFPATHALPEVAGDKRSSDNETADEINQNERGKKSSGDHPRKERKSRSSSRSGQNSTESWNSNVEATSTAVWSSEEQASDKVAASSRIDSARGTTETDNPEISIALDRPTELVLESEDRSSVTSELEGRTKGSGLIFSIEDMAFWPTNSSQLDDEASIILSSTNDDRVPAADVTVASWGNDDYSQATLDDESTRNMDNSSHDLEPLDQWPVKHSAVVEGDLVLGGLMMVHEREDTITCGPVMPQGGVQALEVMLYTLDRLNDRGIVPGVKIGAHILDDCDKDTYGLEMAVDFIKGSISNIDGAEYHCNKTAVRKVISGVVGAASSVTSIQVANLLRLFRIPQVSFFSTSPELSNKQRFEYFTRTIPSDHYQVKAMVDIVLTMGWSYVSIIYEESNYGIKAFEELEELLGKYDICIAIKEKLVKDSGVAEETAYDNIVLKLLTKPRARGCIIFGSDQEVAGVMRAVRRCNATGAFSWIGSDGWSARGLVSNGNEPEVEGTLSVQPQANPVKGFEEYFLNLTVENNRRNPWFVEFWEDHFQCRYPNSSTTPYNKKYTKPCTTKERLTKQNTAFEDQLQFVSDAVMAFAYAFRDMHRDLCHGKPGLCDAMKPTKGTELLKYLRKVDFEGLSGDKFRFDKDGDGPARYNIIHFKQTEPGKYKWIRVGKYLEGELRLNMSEIQFKLGHPQPPESVCSLPCEVGQAKKYVEGERCCWHCFNCTQYQIRHPKDETQCIPCRQGTVPDETHSTCRDIPEEFLRPESGWAIGAMSFSSTGILITLFVCGVFLKHNDTPVVRASGRELSYVLLSGILLCYLVTFALVLRPTDIVCGIQRFAAGFCFTVVYAALLTKTNRISRIFNASKHSAKRPSFISPRSQLIICSGLVFVQILINGVWMIIDPAKAMHHYPTREDNLLVCNSYIDASYMIAFAYPIMLIVVCTVYAVLTRKIPEAFNESKHIGFTMYTTCVIWLAFVPLYFGTGNNVALRITSMSVTISLSASVTIACLFSPKLYIILIRPERNVRQSMMPARYSTTKSSAVTATNASSMIAPITLTAATCDQNKTVKKHIITTIDCSTQSEYFELEVKDQKNGKPPPALVSRSTQTLSNNEKDSNAVVANKDSKENTATTKQLSNNARIGNGPVNQADVSL